MDRLKELTNSYKNGEEKVPTSNAHWRNGTALILGDLTISGLMGKKCPETKKLKLDFFLAPNQKICFICLKKT